LTDLIITSFPQRWQQPKDDPFDVLNGIIEDMLQFRVHTVYDLASRITNRCSGMFYADKHHDDYQFLDIFESSIGDLVIGILLSPSFAPRLNDI
jgi:hypothetical protein